MSHCPACATADELARHRDAAYPEWSVRRATLNFAVVIARRNYPAYEPVQQACLSIADGGVRDNGASPNSALTLPGSDRPTRDTEQRG